MMKPSWVNPVKPATGDSWNVRSRNGRCRPAAGARAWLHVYPLLLLLQLSAGPIYCQSIEIQKGAHLKVRLSSEISTKTARKGEEFEAVMADDLAIEDRVAIPKGSILHGSVIRSTRAGRLRGRAELALHFHTVELSSGDLFDISASPVAAEGERLDPPAEGIVRERASGKRTAATVVGATAAGAAVGAAVEGRHGAAIGAGIGVIAGIIGSAAGGEKDQVLSQGTTLELVLDRPASVPLRSAKR